MIKTTKTTHAKIDKKYLGQGDFKMFKKKNNKFIFFLREYWSWGIFYMEIVSLLVVAANQSKETKSSNLSTWMLKIF